jgi:hypothetical protein
LRGSPRTSRPATRTSRSTSFLAVLPPGKRVVQKPIGETRWRRSAGTRPSGTSLLAVWASMTPRSTRLLRLL